MTRWTAEQIARAKKDFRVFVFIVWRSIGLPKPTEVQNDIANVLQNPPGDRIIIEGFRGVAKSFLTCALVVWLLWKNPLLKIMIVSASKEKADLNAAFIKKIIYTIDFLECLRLTDEDRRAGLRDTNNLFDVHGAVPDISPSVKSVGITGQLTGSRADVLISDDVEVPGNSGTQLQRDRLSELVKEYDAILKPGGRIIYLGTPQCEASLYVELQNRGYQTVIWPVEYPNDAKEREFYGDRLGPLLKKRYDADPEKWRGKPTDPLRFNEEEIEKRKLSYGRAGFALQFMLNTNLSDQDKFPLRVADFIVTDLDREETSVKWAWASGPQQRLTDVPSVALKGDFFYGPFDRSKEVTKYTGTMLYIDPSGRGKDETSYGISKFLNGFVFIMELGGFMDGYGEATLRSLATKAKFWGVNDVDIEPNFGDGMFTKLITPVFKEIGHPCNIQETKHSSKQKEAKIIDGLEPALSRHKIILAKSAILDDYEVYQRDPRYSLIYQMTRLSREKGALAHDDRIEALWGCVIHWLEYMDRDAQTGLEELLEEELEKWMDPSRGVFYIPEINPPQKIIKARNGVSLGNILEGAWRR
ncbi:phage terminase large subunit [Anaeroselena agilis]|uniref:Phage terminase large subunit n=1 Tax=Anaeroselena agilis TaxID=3063788 RepID=A0ABU3NV12_9FIRM|nr:phage terminase large subunit [Selenomonadales bacterium 4137-cl]